MEPLTLPIGVPPGEYRIGYLSSSNGTQQLQPLNLSNPNPTLRIGVEESQALAVGKSSEKPAKAATRDPIEEDPRHLRNRVEFEAIRMADQTVSTKHLLAKRLQIQQELGEGFVLNRAYRQETEQLIRLVGETSRQTLTQARANIKHAQEIADAVVESGRKNAQPPDSTGPVVSLLGQLLTLITTAIGPGKRSKGEPILDAILGGDEGDDKKLATVLAELKKAKRRLAEAEKASTSTKKSATKSKGKKQRQGKSNAAKSNAAQSKPKPSSGATKSEAKSATKKSQKQLPAKGAR